MIICVLATKLGDSVLKDSDNNVILIHPDDFYKKYTEGYWMLKRVGYNWKILRLMKCMK